MWVETYVEEATGKVFLLITGDDHCGVSPGPSVTVAVDPAPAAVRGNELGLSDAVKEIVDAVLDAADLEILEGIGEDRRGRRSAGVELLRELMVDFLRRYRARMEGERS